MKETIKTVILIWLVFCIQKISEYIGYSLSFAMSLPLEQDVWTIISSVYSHAGLGHILSNTISLVIVGILFEQYVSDKKYHTFFLFSGVAAGIAQVVFSFVVSDMVGVIGASGSIYAMAGYVLMANDISQHVVEGIDFKKWQLALILTIISISITILTAAPNVALVAHAFGMILGLCIGLNRNR